MRSISPAPTLRTGRASSGSRPGNVKRVFAAGPAWTAEDWAAAPGVRRLLAFLETKTVWHPVGT